MQYSQLNHSAHTLNHLRASRNTADSDIFVEFRPQTKHHSYETKFWIRHGPTQPPLTWAIPIRSMLREPGNHFISHPSTHICSSPLCPNQQYMCFATTNEHQPNPCLLFILFSIEIFYATTSVPSIFLFVAVWCEREYTRYRCRIKLASVQSTLLSVRWKLATLRQKYQPQKWILTDWHTSDTFQCSFSWELVWVGAEIAQCTHI